MIKYSSYDSTNYRKPGSLTDLNSLEAAYSELLELRERVRKAEAAAAMRPSTDMTKPRRQRDRFSS
jgi:hypothetical protein